MTTGRLLIAIALPLCLTGCADDPVDPSAAGSSSTSGTTMDTGMTTNPVTGTGATTDASATTGPTATATATDTAADTTGTTGVQCDPQEVLCDGHHCIDPMTDDNYCGASGSCLGSLAGERCAGDERCMEGVCRVDCRAGELFCDGRCVDPEADEEYCGAWGNCQGDQAGEECLSDEVCREGKCESEAECDDDELVCDDRCVDPDTDEDYCGARGDCEGNNAGDRCASDEVCDDGRCEPVDDDCDSDEVLCDGQCIDPDRDEDYCGASNDCRGDDAGDRCRADEVCRDGKCEDDDGSDSDWDDADQIDDEDGDASEVAVTIDTDGNAMAVWVQGPGVFARRYDERDGRWDSSVQLGGASTTLDVDDFAAAGDEDGNVHVMWLRDGSLWGQYFDAGDDEWLDDARTMETDGNYDVESIALSVDRANGRAMVVWYADYFNQDHLRYARFNAGDWGSAAGIGQTNGEPEELSLAINDSGDAVLAYLRDSSGRSRVEARRFVGSGSGSWRSAAWVGDQTSNDELKPVVYIDEDGDSVAAWVDDDSTPTVQWATLDGTDTSWGSPDEIDDSDDVDAREGLSFAGTGDAEGILVWVREDSDSNASVYGSVYDGGDFETAERVQTDEDRESSAPAVSVSSDGQAIVVWTAEDSGENRVFSNTGDVNSSDGNWASDAAEVESGNDDAEMPVVAINRQGRAVAAWLLDASSDAEVWANVYAYDRLYSVED